MKLTKAVVLAAGRGTRMQELTESVPKPMLVVGRRPLLAHVVDHLRSAGLSRILIVTGFRAEQIERYFGQDPEISFRRQETANGTARAALLAREFADGDPFLVTYGDILAGPEAYLAMMERLDGGEAVAAVKWVQDPYQGAAVYVEGERVTRIIEKPLPGTSATHWNSAGFYCFRPSIFPRLEAVELSPRGEYELTDAVRLLVESGAVVGHYPIPGAWRDVGRPEDLAAAEEIIQTLEPGE